MERPVSNKLTRSLEHAKRCLSPLGVEMQPAGVSDEKSKYPALMVKWGEIPVLLIDKGGVVQVTLQANIPEELSSKLSTLPPEIREQYKIVFLQEIMSSHRTGAAWNPKTLRNIEELRTIILTQSLYLSSNTDTCNRLIDAIQEIVSVYVRIRTVFNSAIGTPSTPMVQPTSPPPTMYG